MKVVILIDKRFKNILLIKILMRKLSKIHILKLRKHPKHKPLDLGTYKEAKKVVGLQKVSINKKTKILMNYLLLSRIKSCLTQVV